MSRSDRRLPSGSFGTEKTRRGEIPGRPTSPDVSPANASSPSAASGAGTNLVSIVSDFKRIDGDFNSLRSQFREFQKKFAGVDPKMIANAQNISGVQHEINALRQENEVLRNEAKQVHKEVQSLQVLKQEVLQMKTKIERDKQAMEKMMETMTRKSEKGITQAVKAEIQKLSSQMGSLNDVASMKFAVANTASELDILKKRIFDSGVLAPKVQVVEEQHEEERPVGTIELGEFMFAARLLVKLGFEKQRNTPPEDEEYPSTQTRELAKMQYFSDEDSEDMPKFDELVSGIADIPVREYGFGYARITYGWLFLCIITLIVQLLMVVVLIRHGIHDASTSCMQKARPAVQWWTLHISKACAVVVAGILVGKELMDNVHYWMIANLLLPNNVETHITALVRLLMNLLILVANVMVFLSAHNPAAVFMNVTALTFIGEIGYFGLEIAKRGLFGHVIAQTMTSLNFTINLTHELPWWFNCVRNTTLGFVFVSTTAASLFVMFGASEPVCNPDGSMPETFLTDVDELFPSWLQ